MPSVSGPRASVLPRDSHVMLGCRPSLGVRGDFAPSCKHIISGEESMNGAAATPGGLLGLPGTRWSLWSRVPAPRRRDCPSLSVWWCSEIRRETGLA